MKVYQVIDIGGAASRHFPSERKARAHVKEEGFDWYVINCFTFYKRPDLNLIISIMDGENFADEIEEIEYVRGD